MSHLPGVFEISASGMDAERLRLQTATTNLANASSVRTPDGLLYQPMRVITHTAAAKTFSEAMDRGTGPQAVVAELLPSGGNPREVYDPDHPFADQKGFIQQAAIDPSFEMSQIMLAVRAYEANIKAFGAARAMAQAAMRIGEQS